MAPICVSPTYTYSQMVQEVQTSNQYGKFGFPGK